MLLCLCSPPQIGGVQGLAQFLCQLTKGVSGIVGDVVGSQVRVPENLSHTNWQ